MLLLNSFPEWVVWPYIVNSVAVIPYSAAELELESPLQTAMLFSLVGTGSFVANQWHTTVQTNVEKMNAMIKGIHIKL